MARLNIGCTLIGLSLLVIGLLSLQDAHAQWQYDPKQLPLLPPYCKFSQLYRSVVPGGNDPTEIERWRTQLGGDENFAHIHHYCWAMENTNRALFSERTKLERDRRLSESLGDFDYVINRVRRDFVLLPEILTKKAENLIRLGKGPQAVPDLVRAIELNSMYWPPYAVLSDYYKDAGDAASARLWLDKGLAVNPGVSALKRRLTALSSGPKAGSR